jgi:Protein of unknown function (DUF1565)
MSRFSLRRLFRVEAQQAKRQQLRTRFRPRLALLEDRTVPATLSVPSGSYPTIQAAVNAANPGDTVQVAPGTYSEQLTITNSVALVGSVDGSNNPTTTLTFSAPGGNLVTIQGAAFAGSKEVTIRNFALQGNGANNIDYGVFVDSSSRFDKLTVDNSSFSNFDTDGVGVFGATATAGVSVKNVVLNQLTFTNNGYQAIGGAGDIKEVPRESPCLYGWSSAGYNGPSSR